MWQEPCSRCRSPVCRNKNQGGIHMQDISRYLKNFRNFMIIFAAVYLIMGIALIASPDGMSKILGIVVGLIAMALGAFALR